MFYDDKGCSELLTTVYQLFVKIDFTTPAAITVTRAITCANDEEIEVNVTRNNHTNININLYVNGAGYMTTHWINLQKFHRISGRKL
jgi:hypothetical protein